MTTARRELVNGVGNSEHYTCSRREFLGHSVLMTRPEHGIPHFTNESLI